MMKKFEQLSGAQIRKIESAANKATGTNDCKVTGYFTKISHPFDFDPDYAFVDVECEICHSYEKRADITVRLSFPMTDARRSIIEIVR